MFSAEEKKLIEFAKQAFPKFIELLRKRGALDTIYSCVISDSGKIYEGKPFESGSPGGTICCERVAIANMTLRETEKARIKAVLVMGPVGKGGKLTPCGLCRNVIHEYSDVKATVLCAGGYFERSQKNFDFLFKKIKKYTINELYPRPWSEGKWT